MEFLGGKYGAGMAGGGIGATGWTSSFGVQKISAAYNSGTADLLRQVE